MKIFITGICGFAGSALARELRTLIPGAEISGMDSLSRAGSELNRRALMAEGIRVIHGDVRCASDFDTLPDVDWVIDAAAQPSVLAGVDGKTSPRQLMEHNLLGTVNMLEYCRRTGAGFILLSTSRVYSVNALNNVWRWPAAREAAGMEWDEEMPGSLLLPAADPILKPEVAAGISENFSTEAPVSLYGATKLASERLALEYTAFLRGRVWINRCGVLAGAGQFGTAEQGIFSYWIHAWKSRRPLRYTGFGGKGRQVRDALHPADLAALIARQILDAPTIWTHVYNIGGGLENSMSLAELSRWCAARFGPHEVAEDDTHRTYDVPWIVMDSSVARRVWDWRPQRSLSFILEEIAQHAEAHPGWLEVTGG